jgi:hypothetical protein
MEAFKKRFCNDYIVLNNLVENLQFERKAYYGGRTEIYVNGKYTDKVYYYDVNSIYAYVMKMYKYTTEYIFCRDNPTITKVKEYLNKGWLIIAECYLNIPLDTKIPPYPYKKDEVLTFPTGRIKTTLATPEVINAMEEGHLEGFGHVSFYHSANIFEEYIDFFYGKRLEYKANDDNRAMLMKHFLTHLYGKFGQKKDKWEKISEQDLKKIPGFEDFNLEAYILGEYKPPTIIVNYKNITPHIRYIAGELQISTSEGEGAQSFPAIAAHVTSYARMVLYKALKYCLDNNIRVFYCDTDSLFTDKELPGHMVDQAELGKLKLEHTFNFGIDFMGLKNYAELNDRGEKIVNIKDTINLDTDSIIPKDSKIIKGDSWKLKGISSTAEMIDETHFIQQEWSGISKQQYFVRYGRQPGEYWILYVSKQINPENKKGILNNNNEYEPLKIKDY